MLGTINLVVFVQKEIKKTRKRRNRCGESKSTNVLLERTGSKFEWKMKENLSGVTFLLSWISFLMGNFETHNIYFMKAIKYFHDGDIPRFLINVFYSWKICSVHKPTGKIWTLSPFMYPRLASNSPSPLPPPLDGKLGITDVHHYAFV